MTKRTDLRLAARQAGYITDAELARECGVTRPAISMWLSGARRIPVRRLIAFARMLRVPIETLLPPEKETP